MTPKKNPRIPGLDLLRAFAICLVMAHHYHPKPHGMAAMVWIDHYGWSGVDLFFVLSGFLIGCQVLGPFSRGERFDFGFYGIRRLLRIIPAYAVVLVLYFAWPSFRETPEIRELWRFLTFSMNIGLEFRKQGAFSHAWSLCVEEFFYLFFPWAVIVAYRSSLQWKAWFAAGLVALSIAGAALRWGLWSHFIAPLAGSLDRSLLGALYSKWIYYPTWGRLDGLLTGVGMACLRLFRPEWFELQARKRAWVLFGLGGGCLGSCLWLFADRFSWGATVWGFPLLSIGFGFWVWAFSVPSTFLGDLRIPGSTWLAGASYSLYLVHKPLYALVHPVLLTWGVPNASMALLFASLPPVLLGGALLHYGIERPALRLLRPAARVLGRS